MSLDVHGHLNHHGLLVVHLHQVDVENGVGHGMELDVLEHSLLGDAVVGEVDHKHLGGVDEFAHIGLVHHQVGSNNGLAVATNFHDLLALEEFAVVLTVLEFNDFATVKHHRNLALAAQRLGCLLAEVRTGLGIELECLHSQLIKCVTQN